MTEPATPSRPWLPYVVPMVLFSIITMVEAEFSQYYVALYIAKAVIVTAALIYFRSVWKEIKFEAKWILPSAVIGVILFAVWVGIQKNFEYPPLPFGARVAFNPLTEIEDSGVRAAFLGFRFFGLVLMVPLMEEIFWRSFLLRFITKPDFLSLKVGEFSTNALLIGAALFALAHTEWLPAVIFALAISLWLRYTKSLFAAIIVHVVTNLALGLWIVTQRDWIFW